jgi:hypothetical protein
MENLNSGHSLPEAITVRLNLLIAMPDVVLANQISDQQFLDLILAKPKKAKLLFERSNMVMLCILSEFNFARAFAKGMASLLLLFPRGSLRDWPVKKSRFFFLDKKELKNQDLQEKQ